MFNILYNVQYNTLTSPVNPPVNRSLRSRANTNDVSIIRQYNPPTFQHCTVTLWTLCIQPIYSINHPAGAARPTRWQKTLLDKTTHTQKRNETTTTHDTRLEKFDPIWHNPAEGTFHGRTFKLQKGLQSPAGRWTNNMFNSLVPEDPDLWSYSWRPNRVSGGMVWTTTL